MKGLIHFEPNSYYHIVNHAVGYENIFHTEENYYFLLNKYSNYMPSVCDTLAYCLMPNHIHFLIKTHAEETLLAHHKYKLDFHKLIMQELSNLLNSYAKAYNKLNKRKGALWIDFTKRFLINSDLYLTSTINYIHQNPIKHGFVATAEDCKFSSFTSMLSDKPTPLKRKEVINLFGNSQDFLEFHKNESVVLIEELEY